MVFTDIFIRRPILAVVVSLLILLIGFRSMLGLQIRQFPRIDVAQISVQTGYPGASPELMQGFVTNPIEQAIASAEGIDYIQATSSQGRSNITAYIKLNYDPNKALAEIMAKVQQVKNQIPRESNDPVIQKFNGPGGGGGSVVNLLFTSEEMSRAQVTDYGTRVVQPVLAAIEGVAAVDFGNSPTLAMRLWLDPDRMAARGITGQDIQQSILANNVQSAPGQSKSYFTITNISADTGLTDVEQFRDMVVKSQGGRIVRMRDIATVELDAQSMSGSGKSNGKTGSVVFISATPSGNPLTIAKEVRQKVAEMQRDLPPNLKMEIGIDSTVFIQSSIDEVVNTISQAVLIVILIIFLALGSLRSVVIPVVTIPLSLVGVGALMFAAGFTINLLTLLAMVLAIGLVVDDAIVVVENVHRHIREGRTPIQAALVGAREIIGPVIAMTITLAAVYAPIGFLSGVTGSLFREFAFTLAGAVIISGTIALTLSPMLASVLLRRDEGRFADYVEHLYDKLTDAYSRLLDNSLNYRSATMLFAAVVLGSLYFLYTGAKTELAPPEDQSFLMVPFRGPQSANINYTEAFAEKIEAVTSKFPELEARFNFNGGGFGQNQGQFFMRLSPWGQRTRSQDEIQQQVQQELSRIPGLRANVFGPSPLPGSSGGAPVQMVISSIDAHESIYKVMEEIKTAARSSGLFAVVDSDLDFNTPEIRLKIDHSKASELGISMQAISSTLATLVGENYVNRFILEGRSYQVIPQVPRDLRLNAQELTRYYVTTSSGQQIPLSTIMSVQTGVSPNQLTQYNQLNSATFTGVPKLGVTVGQTVQFLESEMPKILPAQFRHDYLSDARQYVNEGNALIFTFVFALIVIYLVLAALLESARDPLVILVSVPMSICGALIPLYFGDAFRQLFNIYGATINIYSQIGLVTLIGLISKHGILMVSFANEMQRNEGADRRTAIQNAARVRLRPILMTTAAIVLGVLPLLLASGAGATSRFSIGLVIASGMTVGTIFTLFVLPAVYTLIAQDHRQEANTKRAREIAAVTT